MMGKMTNKTIFNTIIFFIIIFSIIWKTNNTFNSIQVIEDFSSEISILKKITESNNIIIKPTLNENIYKYISSRKKNTGHFISTKKLKEKKTGYGGNLDIIFILDNRNIIKKNGIISK